MLPFPSMMLGKTAAASGNGILDAYTANMWSAAGLPLLVGSASNSVLARNTSTTATANIGFSGGSIDSTALLAHCGAAGTVEQFLDQSGNSRPFANAGTPTAQPAIVSGSSYLGKLQFDGSNDTLSTGAVTLGGMQGVTIFFKGRLRSTAALQILIEHTANYNLNDAFVVYYDNSISRLVVASHQSSLSRYAISEFNVAIGTDSVWCVRINRAQTSGANQCVLFRDGVKQTRTGSTGETAPVPSTNLDPAALSIGSRAAASLFAALDLYSLVVYTTAKSDADCAAISALL